MVICAPITLAAQSSSTASADPQSDRIAKLEQQIAGSKGSADNAWMLMCSALVLLMTGPGLALFYGGLVRKKNVLATMMQSFALMAVVTVVWAIVGYSLSFGEGNSFIGGWHNLFLHGVGAQPDADYAATIPAQTFMIYQLMFAIITPALITGAFAERMKFSALVVFMALWSAVVYSPMAHMVWGKGGLLNAALGGRFPMLDFAGGTVVHVTSGVSALVCALYLGHRLGYQQQPMPPHSMVLSFIGACLLWVGWFGFNAGSALSAGSLATSSFVATLRRRCCCNGMVRRGMDSQRQAQRAGGHLRRCCRIGSYHARSRFCYAYGFAWNWSYCRCFLLSDGHNRKVQPRL
jgi:Amt family ammonium transporter